MTYTFDGRLYNIKIVQYNYLDNMRLVLVRLLELDCDVIVNAGDINYGNG